MSANLEDSAVATGLEKAHRVEAHRTEAYRMEAYRVEAHSVEAHRREAHRMETHSVEAHRVEVHNMEVHRMEAHSTEGHSSVTTGCLFLWGPLPEGECEQWPQGGHQLLDSGSSGFFFGGSKLFLPTSAEKHLLLLD